MRRRHQFAVAVIFTAVLVAGSSSSIRAQTTDPDGPEGSLPASQPEKTKILAAIGDSIRLLMIEHGTRIAFQEKTRKELGGPFWKDYKQSLRWPGPPRCGLPGTAWIAR